MEQCNAHYRKCTKFLNHIYANFRLHEFLDFARKLLVYPAYLWVRFSSAASYPDPVRV